MQPNKVIIALEGFQLSHNWEFGKRALQVLYDADPRLHPDRIGRDDVEMRKKLPCANVDDWKTFWSADFEERGIDVPEDTEVPDGVFSMLFWKRYRPLRVFGHFRFMSKNQKGTLFPSKLTFECKFTEEIDFLSMFKSWCSLYKPSQGYMHYFGPHDRWQGGNVVMTDEDIRRIGAGLPVINPRSIEMRNWDCFCNGSFVGNWQSKTYNLGQTNFFPPSIITNSVAESLQEEGFEVTRCETGYFVHLCPTLSDVKNEFAEFSRRRAVAKSIIGQHIFAIKNEPPAPLQ